MEFKEFAEKYNLNLTKQQEDAVRSVDGANLILAVPGSGKTTVLVIRIGYMVICKGIAPENIVSITYSREAAKELKIRLASIFGKELAGRVYVGTINAFCYSIIRRYNPDGAFRVDKDTRVLIKNLLWKIANIYPTENEVTDVQTAIQNIKNRMLSDDEIISLEQDIPHIGIIYKQYCNALIHKKTMDYDDQVVYANMILDRRQNICDYYQNRYKYLLVDEAQDTSKLQIEVIRKLTAKNGNLFLVGDEDQSIYSFRGADSSALLEYYKKFDANIFYMETNFRSAKEIIKVSSDFISKNQDRYPKQMIAQREEQGTVKRILVSGRGQQYNYLSECLSQGVKDTAILFRDNDSVVPLVDLFLRRGIPYRIRKNGEIGLFTSKDITEVVSYLKLLVNPYDAEEFLKIYYRTGCFFTRQFAWEVVKEVKRYHITVMDAITRLCQDKDKLSALSALFVSPQTTTQDAITHFYNIGYAGRQGSDARIRNRFALLEIMADREPNIGEFISRFESLPGLIESNSCDSSDAIILSTIHSAKGKEYDTVYLVDVFDGIIPSSYNIQNQNDPVYQEERRLFYVALTRAKNNLFIFSISGRKSSFISEIFPNKNIEKKNNSDLDNKIETKNNTVMFQTDDTYIIGKRVTIVGCGDGEIVNTNIVTIQSPL